jgi:hypothetical protein
MCDRSFLVSKVISINAQVCASKLTPHDLVKNKTVGNILTSGHVCNKFNTDCHDWYAERGECNQINVMLCTSVDGYTCSVVW